MMVKNEATELKEEEKEQEEEKQKPAGNEAASLDGVKADIVGSSGPSDPEETEVDAEVEAEAEVGESAAAELVAKRIALKEGRPVKGQLVLDDEEEVEDGIRFHESGWRDRYYDAKFGAGASQDPELRKDVVKKYLEGLQWVLLYYYQGVPSCLGTTPITTRHSVQTCKTFLIFDQSLSWVNHFYHFNSSWQCCLPFPITLFPSPIEH